jgi:hypothetical protein
MGPSIFVVLIAIVAPLFCAAFIIGAILYYKHTRAQLWHETARLALEKGQPLPVPPDESARARVEIRGERNDVRTGLILIGVGVGIAMFFNGVHAHEAMGIGAIPLCIGVALLLFGLFSRRKPAPTTALPPRT